MEDIGSVIFYIILAVIALAGSLQGKKKKAPPAKPMPPKTVVQQKPLQKVPQPVRQVTRSVSQDGPVSRPQYSAPLPSQEGGYEEPMAAAFAGEGSIGETMAEAFSQEGSVYDTMAAAFAGEGVSSLSDSWFRSHDDNIISDSEIQDAPAYDYGISGADTIISEGFDIKKAVIYSAILNRKEYTF